MHWNNTGCITQSEYQICITSVNWFIFVFYVLLLFFCFHCIFFPSLPQIQGPQNQELVQEVDPPPIAHLHSHTLKPEPQEVVLRSIISGQTNYSPFEKCTFFSSPIFFPPPPLPPCRLLSIYCFHFRSSREEQSRRQKALLPALSQNELHSGSKRAAAAVAQAPKFREIFSCGVPWRLVVFLPTVSPQRFCGISLMDEKQVYLNSFEKWNIDLPYLYMAVLFYCINPTVKRLGERIKRTVLRWFYENRTNKQ